MNRLSPWLILSATVLVVGGCARSVDKPTGNAPDLTTWTQKIRNEAPRKKAPDLPQLAQEDMFNYTAHVKIKDIPAIAKQECLERQKLAEQAAASGDDKGGKANKKVTQVAHKNDKKNEKNNGKTPASDPQDCLRAARASLAGLRASNRVLRDPFAYPVSEGQAGVRPDQDRPKQALEAFPLDDLTMVGSIGDAPNIYALVKGPDGILYYVLVGQYMGLHDGRITSITPLGIDLQEIVAKPTGGWKKKTSHIPLSD